LTLQIEAEPTDAKLWLARGDCYRLERLWELALADYVRARELDPALEALDFSLGLLYLETASPGRALPHLERFIARHPTQPVALLGRARALAALGRENEVEAAYRDAIGALRHPRPEHYLEWADALRREEALRQEDARRQERAKAGESAATEAAAAALAVLDAGIARLGLLSSLIEPAVEIEIAGGRLDAALVRLDALLGTLPRPGQELVLLRKAEVLERTGRVADAREALLEAKRQLASRSPARRSVQALRDAAHRVEESLRRLGEAGANG
jgi:predicted Zn-dependent protease